MACSHSSGLVPPSGVWCPAVTFFEPRTDTLDLVSQKKYYAHLSTTGLAGLVILGTNAEAFLLTREERFRLIQAARQAVGPEFPIMAGVGAHSTGQVLQLINDAAQAGANYVLLLPAAYFGKATTPEVIQAFYDQVAQASSLPILIYNFPQVCNGVDLDSELITKIAKRHPSKIVGVKLTCGSVAKIVRLTANLPPSEFATFGGQSDFLVGGLSVGSAGCIAAFANVFPRTVSRIYALYKQGRTEEALELHRRAALAESPIKAGIAVTKYAVARFSAPMAGIESAEEKLWPRRPYQPPCEAAKAGIEASMASLWETEKSLDYAHSVLRTVDNPKL
ncbi:dihydrodipicolinate synthetase [Fonsecaea erecta]|uniref:Dihydrodipicolinate synthetase n=1 Tax=Fonsecaea erecta TaxID=1367422 RepID=A0A178ZZV3_9EURO|nr:dihydrodipicolinate synthetase [Fonsecaea erecta]OAP64886.1 dihydrodipicolinate synthetase [Fonsecaea erecta]